MGLRLGNTVLALLICNFPILGSPVFICDFSISKDGRAIELRPLASVQTSIFHESCRNALTRDKLPYINRESRKLSRFQIFQNRSHSNIVMTNQIDTYRAGNRA